MTRNPFERYDDVQIKRMQVVYLNKGLKITKKKVAEITGYAVSTVQTYARKFINLLDKAKEYFEDFMTILISCFFQKSEQQQEQ